MFHREKAARPLEFILFDQGVEEDDFLHLVPTIHASRRCDRLITDAEQLVRVLSRQCEKMGGKIGVLHLLTTGNARGFWLGKTWVSIATLPRIAKTLSGLSAWFASPAADVAILCDEDGLDGLVLKRLSEIWGLESIRPQLDRPSPMNYAGPRGLERHSFKLKVAGVRFENEEGGGSYLFT